MMQPWPHLQSEVPDLDMLLFLLYNMRNKEEAFLPNTHYVLFDNKTERLLHQLYLDELVFMKGRTNSEGRNYNAYAIHMNAVNLYETAPEGFQSKPYSYFLKLKADREQLDADVRKSQKDANNSVKSTNTFVKVSGGLTVACLIATIWISWLTYHKPTDAPYQPAFDSLYIEVQLLRLQLKENKSVADSLLKEIYKKTYPKKSK